MKKKSDYAVAVTCNPGYAFGLLSNMNAHQYFGTDADWEISGEGFSKEYQEKVSNSFRFNVNWHELSELNKPLDGYRLPNGLTTFDRFWVNYWVLALKLLKEKKYKVVCVTQADMFTFVNIDEYFKKAEEGFAICGENIYCPSINVKNLPYGSDRNIWGRWQLGVFDNINFFSEKDIPLIEDIIKFQIEPPFREEANYSVTTLNRAVCKHRTKDTVIGLPGQLWSCDSLWGTHKFILGPDGDTIYNDFGKVCGWHCRWWQRGRAESEFRYMRTVIKHFKDLNQPLPQHHIDNMNMQEYNYNLVKTFMERFHDMTPDIKTREYEVGVLKNPLTLGEV